MNIIWGIVLILFTGVLCWLAQVINALSPKLAARWGVTEPESDVDRTYFVDGRGEAIWDAFSLWILPVAGVLLIVNNPLWAYFGLTGGAMYLYFVGRLMIVRRMMQKHGIKIGKPATVKLYNVVLALWGVIAVVTIIKAVAVL